MKKQSMKWISFILAIIICISSGVTVPAQATEIAAEAPAVYRVGDDTTTQGNWEGTYGKDIAILYGYQYDWTNNIPEIATASPRRLLTPNTYDLKLQTTNAYTVNHSCTGYGSLRCYTGEYTGLSEAAVLNYPAGETYASRAEFVAMNSSSTKDVQTTYTVSFSDNKPHLFTLYAAYAPKYGDVELVFYGENNEVLYTDIIMKNAYTGGFYLTYMVPGSFTMKYKFTNQSDSNFAFNASFFDTPAANGTSNLTASASQEADAVELHWQETGLAAGTKVVVWRKAGEEGWNAVAAVDGGVCQYRDTAVELGKTYTYCLSTSAGTSYSAVGSVAECTMPGTVIAGPKVYRTGTDTTTQGNWEGTYGKDIAVLYGYQYDWTNDLPAATQISSSGRRLMAANTHDLVVQTTQAYTVSHNCSGFGSLRNYTGTAVNIEESAVLNYPAGETYASRAEFVAMNSSSGANVPTTYTVSFSDNKPHLFTLYSAAGPKYGNVVITFYDGDTVLYTETIAAKTYSGGFYLTYMVPASFTMKYFHDHVSDEYFSFNASFFDTPAENGTKDLVCTQGSEARSSKLTWKETNLPEQSTVTVLRMAENENWMPIATLAPGTGEYEDTGLLPGTTYTYCLHVASGSQYSAVGMRAQYTVPDYTATVLSFDKQLYSLQNTAQTAEAKLTLKSSDGTPIAQQSISLNAIYSFGEINLGSGVTDDEGVVTFRFTPPYLGQAELKASYAVNDALLLAGTNATAVLMTGDEVWDEAPVLWKISDAVMPDELINLNGYGLRNPDMTKLKVYASVHTGAVSAAEPPVDATELEIVQTDARDGYYLVSRLPSDATPGIYDIWVYNGYGYSNPMILNAARPLFISEYEAWNGLNIEISGRNFQGAQFGFNGETKVRLINASGEAIQSIVKNTPYSLTFRVNAQPGEYAVEVSNDGGVTWCGLASGQKLTVVETGKDPLGIGFAWVGHFNWDDPYYDVTSYGANGTDEEDDTTAVMQAIAAAQSQENGGVIYFPDGNYRIGSLQLPANIVLCGQSKENTILTYCGAGGPDHEMFISKGTGATQGHQGFANFSVRLSDDNVRPDTFFWLGHTWANYAADQSVRTASEFFLKNIDLTYPMTTCDHRGLAVVVVADQRLVIQDCSFSGYSGTPGNIKLNNYSYYESSTFHYGNDLGVSSLANFAFFEHCTASSQWNTYDRTHGFFGRSYCHMEGNHVEGMGTMYDTGETGCDGEAYCAEMDKAYFGIGKVLDASENTVTVQHQPSGSYSALADNYTIEWGRLAVRITAGRGMGQYLEVDSINAETGVITLKGTWKVIPDHTSKYTLILPLDCITIYNNTMKDCTKGIYFYGNIYDGVAANNFGENTEGIYVHSAHAAGNRDVPSCFVSIRENVLEGVSPASNVCNISMRSQRQLNSGEFYAVSIYGIEVRHNQITGLKGLTAVKGNEAPQKSGIVSWSAVTSSNANSDGYCGDNTNLIFENNLLQELDTAITVTLGDYGVVSKGNVILNTDEAWSDSGAQNVTQLESGITAETLRQYITLWEAMDLQSYTEDSCNALRDAMNSAKQVAEDAAASAEEITLALQEVRIAAGCLQAKARYTDKEKGEASIGNVVYPTFAEAMAKAEAGDEVRLLADITTEGVLIKDGIDLDLHGHVLTAKYVVAFGIGEVIDSAGSGLLKCQSVRLGANNAQMPVWDSTADGYRLFTMVSSQKFRSQSADNFVFIAKPILGVAANDAYMAMERNGLTVKAKMTWQSTSENEVEQLFVLKTEDVQTIYSSTKIIKLTVNGAANYVGKLYTTMVVESDTGVVWAASPLLYTGE